MQVAEPMDSLNFSLQETRMVSMQLRETQNANILSHAEICLCGFLCWLKGHLHCVLSPKKGRCWVLVGLAASGGKQLVGDNWLMTIWLETIGW